MVSIKYVEVNLSPTLYPSPVNAIDASDGIPTWLIVYKNPEPVPVVSVNVKTSPTSYPNPSHGLMFGVKDFTDPGNCVNVYENPDPPETCNCWVRGSTYCKSELLIVSTSFWR